MTAEPGLRVKFLLVCEGPSDRHIVPHLESLCVRAGAVEAIGDAPDLGLLPRPPGKAIEEQAAAALRLAGEVHLLFAHQDADRRDPEDVRRRIDARLSAVRGCPPHVCVVPVQEIEAWLLLDERAIRAVAGRPRGTAHLGLPEPGRIESTPSPKEVLEAALAAASEASGARLRKVRSAFREHRSMLFQRLDVDGPIQSLPAWRRLVLDVQRVIDLLQAEVGRPRETGKHGRGTRPPRGGAGG